MPIYEFHCAKCEHDSEILVRSSDWTGTKCPHCGSTKLSKKFSTFASAMAGNEATACSTGNGGGGGGGGCCGCAAGRPHRH
jgi:putative FmdB family regulatory protein